ncbi:hypothetical protein NDU88_009672 [Pleurodeles waltl]|uniref:Uncharacterized protein n=1 Tax=Pleurodeles waltl TaxID=8319 RepID=A0AAV7PWH1_PLEWA|nr:hypothetical protein NDU88_009672 [Pleurodeles waltl]
MGQELWWLNPIAALRRGAVLILMKLFLPWEAQPLCDRWYGICAAWPSDPATTVLLAAHAARCHSTAWHSQAGPFKKTAISPWTEWGDPTPVMGCLRSGSIQQAMGPADHPVGPTSVEGKLNVVEAAIEHSCVSLENKIDAVGPDLTLL